MTDVTSRKEALEAEIARLDWEIAEKRREIEILREEVKNLEVERFNLLEDEEPWWLLRE
jgi:chromosome segregation ATPase